MKSITPCLGLLILLVSIVACTNQNLPSNFRAVSPDGEIELHVSIDELGELTYQINKQEQAVILPSILGFKFKNQPPLTQFSVVNVLTKSHARTWQNVWGERKDVIDNHNEIIVSLQEKSGERLLNVSFRVFNDGIGFRYTFPEQPTMNKFIVMNELTQFKLNDDHTSWWIEANYDDYEKLYTQSRVSATKEIQTPYTMRTDKGLYVSIHEAHLYNYPSMTLQNIGNNGFEANLVPWQNGDKARLEAPFSTPWRTIQIADSAKQLIDSDIILNLNEPNKIADTSWIEPMTFSGIWWGVHIGVHTWKQGERHGATTERAKQYIDFAVENNIGAVLFEGWNKGWEDWGSRDAYVVPADDFDLQGVASYAKEKGVLIVGHNETGGNVKAYEQHVEEIFSLYNDLGINVVKTGYVAPNGFSNGEHHQGQWGVNHYQRITELAAKYNIMLNVHEPVKDTGERRTWPNIMTREGARGGEWNAWSEGNPPEHTLILPFTRLLAGPMDYTVGIVDVDFSNFAGKRFDWHGKPQTANYRVHTTVAKQLANMVILYSPLQMVADLVENYRGHAALNFIRHFKADYTQQWIPHASIGEYITVVRETHNEWFIGSSTNSEERELTLTLDFLPSGKTFKIDMFKDGEDAHWQTNPESLTVSTLAVNSQSTIRIKMASGGGFAARIYE